jgi:hypothetical protein
LSWGVAQKQRFAGNSEINRTVFIKWVLKRITKSCNSLGQRLALSNTIALQKLPEFGKLKQPGFILLIDEWDAPDKNRVSYETAELRTKEKTFLSASLTSDYE